MQPAGQNELDVVIASLGHLGDGVAETDSGQYFVPFTLAGESVRIHPLTDGRAELLEILKPAASRVAAPCRHFGVCGGCNLQHIEATAYAEWKCRQVVAALTARGIECDVEPLVPAAPRSRRRAGLAATRTKKGVTIGYYMRASHTIMAAQECPLVVPEIENALEKLAFLVEPGLSRKGRASLAVTATQEGLDVAVSGGKEAPDGPLRAELAKRAASIDLARLTWESDILAERRAPTVMFSGLRVAPPPGAFLQATAEGEAVLVRLVLDGVGDAKRVVDLFAGCGTFTAALAKRSSVLAVEGEAKPLAALDRALRQQGPGLGLKPVECVTRDLFRRPVHASELLKTDAVIFDPPRAGAAAQCEMLAKSGVPTVVGVSCNPATFARDARTLIDGGYALTRVTPVDQFLWSPHIELVGIFRKE
ncbi:MAG: class I SAM-dependent RNA methyltransferase [Parvibaculum sp.]|uniref:class I SAM-dependent RNA methyltransferase n=1 Tax=Parvibaculum sp. TaxID=2024848 RepID=UPI0025DE6970|nr:class I SAM-dependent RNA methyltransferase [Parvibaculum sp.]MCE9649691.1 class I SAM-dependent RNA methyltransferase [Parvibaculum sp.]